MSGLLYYYAKEALLFSVIATAFVTVLSLCALVTGFVFWRKTLTFRFHSQNPNIRVDKMEIEYTILDRNKCDYVRTVEFKALVPVDQYVTRFHWTGDGKVSPVLLSGAQSVVVEDHPKGAEPVCIIKLGKMLNAGDSHRISYKLQFRDATKPVKPYLGFDTDTHIKELVQCVRFNDPAPTKFKNQIFASRLSEIVLQEWEFDVDADWKKEARWSLRAIPRNYYRVAWEWPK